MPGAAINAVSGFFIYQLLTFIIRPEISKLSRIQTGLIVTREMIAMDFSYHMPTRVFFGNACIEKNVSELALYGKKAFIVTGKTSAVRSGAIGDLCEALSRSGVAWIVYDKILPNPTIENVRDAAIQARNFGADVIIGVGGGSPMDAAKAVAVLAPNDLDDEALFRCVYAHEPLPVLAVPTTAGTGSEATPYSILTDVKDKTKKNLSHKALFPRAAFVDPRYTEKIPHALTVNTAIDALSHAVESFLSRKSNAVSAMIALESLHVIGPCLRGIDESRLPDTDIREKLIYAALLAGMAIAQTGTTVVHAMGYSLTFFRNVDHGMANGLLLAEYLRYVTPQNTMKIEQMLNALGMKHPDELEVLIKRLMKPDFVLSDEEIAVYAAKALPAKSVENTVPCPGLEEIKSLYRKSLGVNPS